MTFQVQVISAAPSRHPADVLAVLVREGPFEEPHLQALDAALGGLLMRCALEEEFKGKDGQSLFLHTHGKVPAHRVLLLGLGRARGRDRDLDVLRQAGARAVRSARSVGAGTLALQWPLAGDADERAAQAQALSEGAQLGAYKFDRYLKEKKPLKLKLLELLLAPGKDRRKHAELAALQAACALGGQLAAATNLARDLVNEPPAKMTPRALADAARAVAKARGLALEVHGRKEIEALHMRLFLGVAQGSVQEPQLVKLSYLPTGAAARRKPLALVGKAVTFDSGGLSLKTAAGMEDMKVDMAGAAAVIAAMDLVGQLQPPFPVHGYFGACENLPGGAAYKPGDVIVGKGGLSVQVVNTDAEGRLVLADLLAWAQETEPAALVDLATLTGAITVALGPFIAGLFSNDDALCAELVEAASAAGEQVWRMPLPPDMEELIKSPIADLKNTGGRGGGAISAALFLQRFVGKVPWAHLDIAGPAALDKEKGYHARGGTGAGVRLLAEWIRRRAAEIS